MHPGSLRCSSLAYDEYAALLTPRDPPSNRGQAGALASAPEGREFSDEILVAER